MRCSFPLKDQISPCSFSGLPITVQAQHPRLPPLPPLLQLGHLEIGQYAPQTLSAEMDAAVGCTQAVCSNTPLSVVASLPPFAQLEALIPPPLPLGHLGTGRNAPKTISVKMDAAVVCTQAVFSNALLSVEASIPQFARLYEQTGRYHSVL